MPGCYGAVLTPYNKVRVDAGATPYSGDYLITKVVHRITPSLYTQELEAKTDSVTEVSAAQLAESLGGGLSMSVSVERGDILMVDLMEHTIERVVNRLGSTYYGKYRGIVTDVDDPDNRCRIRARVDNLLDGEQHSAGRCRRRHSPAMATACVMLPAVGSGVWIEFEAGNLDIPIWSGGWWASGQRPDPQGARLRVIVSENGQPSRPRRRPGRGEDCPQRRARDQDQRLARS